MIVNNSITIHVYIVIKKNKGVENFMIKENLFETKQDLIQKLKESEDKLTHAKNKLKNTENELWLNTEFKKLGYTNKDTRKAYVENQLSELKLEKDLIRNEINEFKRELDLCDDKIKLLSI